MPSDYEKAIEYHMKHLRIAQELDDRVGEGRACWSLGNAHTALGRNEEAIQYASKHLEISKEVRRWIVPQIFKLLPKRHVFFDLVIRFITIEQEACFLLYVLGQIVSWQYNPNLLD